jgi:hypothetical protein
VTADIGALPAAACHEAGHAAATLLLGLPLVQVSIRSDGRNGACITAEPNGIYLRLRDGEAEAVRWAENKMVMLAAGAEAERALRGSASTSGDSDDRNAINSLLSDLIRAPEMTAPPAEWDVYERAVKERRSGVYERAAALLAAPASHGALLALASLLAEKGKVSGPEAEAAVAEYLPPAEGGR